MAAHSTEVVFSWKVLDLPASILLSDASKTVRAVAL